MANVKRAVQGVPIVSSPVVIASAGKLNLNPITTVTPITPA